MASETRNIYKYALCFYFQRKRLVSEATSLIQERYWSELVIVDVIVVSHVIAFLNNLVFVRRLFFLFRVLKAIILPLTVKATEFKMDIYNHLRWWRILRMDSMDVCLLSTSYGDCIGDIFINIAHLSQKFIGIVMLN